MNQTKIIYAHYAACSDSKDLPKRNISENMLKDRAYEIVINHKYDRNQRVLASMIFKFFEKEIVLGLSVHEHLA